MNQRRHRYLRPAALLGATSACAALAACGSGAGSASAPTHVAQTPVAAASSAGGTAPPSAVTGAGNGQGAAAGVDVCRLLGAAQASSINHVGYGAAKSQQLIPGWDQCSYENTGQSADPVDIQPLDVSVMTYPACWSQLESADGPGTPVPGVGDAAFGYRIGLAVKVGSRCIDVTGMTHAEFAGDYSRDVALARIVLGHLN